MGLQWATKNFTVWKHWTAKQLFKQMNNNFNAITHKELTWWKIFLFLIIAYTRWEFPKVKETQLKKVIGNIQYANISFFFCYDFFHIFLPKLMGQYCTKTMQVKWANFVLCSCEVSVKAQEKVCTNIHSFSNHISLEKEHYFFRHLQQNVSLPW